MKREDYQRVKEIFHSALDVEALERSRFLDEKCPDNTDIRREVERLLDSYDSGYLEQPALEKIAEAVVSDRLEIGEKIGHYKIIRKIGAGGMGEVYLAEDNKLNRRVALKILPAGFAADKERMNRFVREARAASALNHPNIITIHEIGESDGTHFIAAEFIDGKTLTEYAKRNSLNLKSILEIAIQIASALDEAHTAGIVHRDIKPDNIMIRANGLVKVLDFGIAKFSEKQSVEIDSEDATAIQPPSTSPGMIIGTANYMSPEQAKGQTVDARTDIFSFGVVLYEMLSGHLPFQSDTPMETIGAILHKEPIPLEKEIPNEVTEIINQCLRKNREERYQTINDVLGDLRETKQNLELQNLMERTLSPEKEEPKTQILQATTANEIHQKTTGQTVAVNAKKNYLAVGLIALLLLIGGIIGYRYFSSAKQIESIAVMPFVNEGGNEDVEYLSEGMTETLIKSLSNLPNLNVKPRSTVFRYKGKNTDLQTIAKELNVQAILNGRVVQRGDDLTLSLELVDAAKDSVIWTESYQRKQSDLVSLQSEIAGDVSTKLKAKLSGAEETKVTKSDTNNPEAYQAYLRGRYFWNRRTTENIKKAIEQFKIAADKDPNYALAYVGLADSYALLSEYTGTPTGETLPQAKAFAEKALKLDPTLAEAHATLGLINEYLWNWAEAEKEFKRAIELNPDYPINYHWYSLLLLALNRNDEALVNIKRAVELDPLSSNIEANLAAVYLLQNKPQESLEVARKLLERDPTFANAYGVLGGAYLELGRNAEAVAAMEKLAELTDRSSGSLVGLGLAYAAAGKRTEALAIIRELEANYAQKQAKGIDIANVYAGLGDKDKAFEWLEKDFQAKDGNLGLVRTGPIYKSLLDDPRFKDLLRRMGLPE